jgi:hypothetical protein
MCLDKHSCSSSSCTFVLRAAGCSTTSFRTWQSVHKLIAVVCVLDETRVIVSRVVAAGNVAAVGSDVAAAVGAWGIVVGSLCIMGARGGMLEGAGGLLVRHLEFQGEPGRSIKQLTRLDERVCSSSCDLVCWAVGHRCGLWLAWVAVSKVAVAVWVLVVAQVVVFRPFASGVVAVIDGDVAVMLGFSRGMGDRGTCWGGAGG